jgi:hypothetical protein
VIDVTPIAAGLARPGRDLAQSDLHVFVWAITHYRTAPIRLDPEIKKDGSMIE